MREGRKTPDTKVISIDCSRSVTFRENGVECKSCKNWFHAKCQGITDTSIRTCRKLYGSVPIVRKKVPRRTQELRIFRRYVDDIVCTVKGDPLEYLENANSLHKHLQFTLETKNCSGDLAFIQLNKNVNKDRKISFQGYQNSTDTGIME